jgi:hypothetical protein
VIFGRLLAVVMAATALASCAGVVAVCLVFAFWALLAPLLGGVLATAAVAGCAAALIAVAAGAAFLALAPRTRRPAAAAPTLGRALGFVRERPVVTVVAAAGAVLVAVLQPRLVAAVARNFLLRSRRTPA